MKKLYECDLCASKNFSFLFEGFDRMHPVKGNYSVYLCKACKLIFLNPQPSGKDLMKHYPGDYNPFKEPKNSSIVFFIYETYYSKRGNQFFKLLFLPLKQSMIRTVPHVPNGKILDVGCGSGDFLVRIKSQGMECYGVEPSDFKKEFAKKHGLNIFQGTLEEANFPDNYFDVITLNHVFEHLPHPTKTLHELHRILKPGGTLVLGIPQSKCLAYCIFGKYWVGLDTPRHLFTYSTKTIQSYAKKAGFSVKKMRFNSGPWQFWASFLYWTNNFRKTPLYLNEKWEIPRLVFLFLLVPSLICNLLRIGDQVEVILTKPHFIP